MSIVVDQLFDQVLESLPGENDEENAEYLRNLIHLLTSYVDEIDPPEVSTWRQTSCKVCGTDVEGDTADPDSEWRDRGGNRTCHVYEGRDEWGDRVFIHPPADQLHVPNLP